jgi:hypothetical protein
MTNKGYCAESSGQKSVAGLSKFLGLFFDFLSEVLLYVSSGTSKFNFGPKLPQEIL